MADSISMIDNCTVRQLTELVGLATQPDSAENDWVLEVGNRENFAALLTEMCGGTEHSGTALLQATCSADTTVDVLVAVKNVAKRLGAAAQDRQHRAAATLLYHLSVASALGYHSQPISAIDPIDRLPLYEELTLALTDEDMAAVFDMAVEHLLSGRS